MDKPSDCDGNFRNKLINVYESTGYMGIEQAFRDNSKLINRYFLRIARYVPNTIKNVLKNDKIF